MYFTSLSGGPQHFLKDLFRMPGYGRLSLSEEPPPKKPCAYAGTKWYGEDLGSGTNMKTLKLIMNAIASVK